MAAVLLNPTQTHCTGIATGAIAARAAAWSWQGVPPLKPRTGECGQIFRQIGVGKQMTGEAGEIGALNCLNLYRVKSTEARLQRSS